MRRVYFTLLVAICLLAGAQQTRAGQPVLPPEIVVSGRAEKRLPADRATVQIAVATKAQTADAAGAENARIQQAVIEAVVFARWRSIPSKQ